MESSCSEMQRQRLTTEFTEEKREHRDSLSYVSLRSLPLSVNSVIRFGIALREWREMICDQRFGLRDRLSIAAEASKPLDFRVFAEPGELALGVVAMALGDEGDRLVAGELAAQHRDGLGVAERGEGAAFKSVGFDELSGLFDQAAIEHFVRAAVDTGIELGAGRVEAEAQDAVAGEGVAALFPLLRDGRAGGERHLDGADDFGRVVGVDERGGGGVEAGEDAVEVGGVFLLGAGAEFGAERFVALRRGEEAIEQRAQRSEEHTSELQSP